MPIASTSTTTTNYSSNWPTEADHDHVDIKPRTFLDSVSVSRSSRSHDDGGGGGGAAMNDVQSSLFSSNLHNPQLPNDTTTVDEKAKNIGEVKDINKIISKKINNAETSNKRSRNETPSPSPVFKVRKEKMGDRITALQQLVSPFGKASTKT
ncbi:hypothetical protein T459_33262 [Capsicum annuum]|uniref:Uncharacterized protein n=1 Tax=Capsicum annuum TaxID=4072 RepID=A0A2G2XZY1_CAPAN|nr:hypothetical protein T459_33262 [Capsicum annuum]